MTRLSFRWSFRIGKPQPSPPPDENSLLMDRPLMRFRDDKKKGEDVEKVERELVQKVLEKCKVKNIKDLENRKEQLIKELIKNPEWSKWSVEQFFNDCLSKSIRKENGELQDWIYDEVRKKDILDD
jgi:hypothetical protein